MIICALICCSFSALTSTAKQKSTISTPSSKAMSSQVSSETDFLLLEENFTDGHMPPEGDSGAWTLQQTNADETWYLDTTVPYTKPYCGTVHRAESEDLQDEWLISPSLNFNSTPKYKSISLRFQWYTCYYVTIWKRYVEFNISISTDGGANWTTVWSFDDMSMGTPPNPFTDWKWHDSNYLDQKPIDLSTYIGEKNVLIAFQYRSNTTASAEEQEFSIDDIKVIATGVGGTFIANAGGPYSWWWPMQYKYMPNGVRFHGNVTNGTVLTQYQWDFGDGNTSFSMPLNSDPINFYNEIGVFNITLTVKDPSFTPPRINISRTTLTLFLLKPPAVNITMPKLSLGIKSTINNMGEYNATFVQWMINISWGPLQLREKTIANGTIENIQAETSETIQSASYVFGMGRIHIIVSVYPENQPGLIKVFNGFKFGPLVLVSLVA